MSVEHPLSGNELRAIKRYLGTRHDALPWLFLSEHGQPMTRHWVNHIFEIVSRRAGLASVPLQILRHSCGFYLANKGYDLRLIQDYLGHQDPKHAVH